MKDKHVAIRIEQCLALAKASNCPRRKFGALLLDPARNVVLMDGYNGGPRGGGELCGGQVCLRDTMGVPSGTRFYFVHSYYVAPADASIVLGETDYITPFCAALASGHAFATQFHPEKSADAGLRLLSNFLRWDGA